MTRRLSDRVVAVLYPDRCLLCDRVIARDTRVCPDCDGKLPRVLPPVCRFCGRPKEMCVCGKKSRHFDDVVSAFMYTDAMHPVILSRLKGEGRRDTVYALAAEMAEAVRREYGVDGFDAVTAVPMTRRDRARRGHDQAHLLADELARQLGLPFRPLLKKISETRPQKELKAHERIGNVIGVFDTCNETDDQRLLLVDDVVTTGSTLDECAKMLKLAGAAYVAAVTAVAACPPDKDKKETTEQGGI